jgi:hypothetical protein
MTGHNRGLFTGIIDNKLLTRTTMLLVLLWTLMVPEYDEMTLIEKLISLLL